MEQKLHPVLSVRLFTDRKCFGPGIAELLHRVDEHRSLRAAALSMEMSYSKAWSIVKNAEESLGVKLLASSTGGRNGGGAVLTEDARHMLAAYGSYCEKLRGCAERLFAEEVAAFVSQSEAARSSSLPGNGTRLRLIKLTREYEQQLGEMIDEWKADQEQNHTNHSPWAIFKNDCHDFDYYLTHLELKAPTDGHVPDSVFFLLDEDRNRLLGAVNIRHFLNDYLLQEGGHIGDGIRPSERRKGYGTELIRLALLECRKLGLERVLITCDKDNVASAKAILKNGGRLENEFTNADGEIVQRYWITLS